MALIRLDKFISERTEYSRSRIKELAAKGRITLDGEAVKRSDIKIDTDTAAVNVCGQDIRNSRYRYLLLNKPKGYVCSTDDKDGETVMKLIPAEMRTKGMFPAGRLDKDSIGALLITDDGELAHKLLSPKSHYPKIYAVRLARPFEDDYIGKFKEGITLSNGEACQSARVKAWEKSDKIALIEICEGKYHQVKRMFAAVGNHVEQLARVSLGALILPEKLAIGGVIELFNNDIEKLVKKHDFDVVCQELTTGFSANLINNLL